MKATPLLLAIFLSIQNAPAQNVEKTLYFVHLTQDLPAAATAIRTIASVPAPTLDESTRSLTLRGTSDQVALGEWLFKSLDVATNGPADPNIGAPYRVSGADDVVRIFYLTYAGTVQEQQEIATLIRTIGEVKQVWVYQPQKALIMRGTAEQLAMAEWISAALDRHKQGQSPQTPEFKLASGTDNIVRMYWASTPSTTQAFQEMATAMRTVSEIRRVFTYNEQKAIAVRGTAEQLDLAAWLITELDQPAHLVSPPYTIADNPLNLVRVFFLNPSATSSAAEFQKTALEVRTGGNIRQIFTYTPTFAIVVRGAENQMEVAGRLLDGKLFTASR
jgi:hypothetical protein